jgi:ABC-type sugar transport system, permease component
VSRPSPIARAGRVVALALFLMFALGPLLWIILTSLKGPKEIYSFPVKYLPSHPSLDSYRQLFAFANFGVYFRNSFFVTLCGAAGAMVVAVFGGYALSRFQFKAVGQGIMLALFVTQTIPTFMLMMPLYLMMATIGLVDNLGALALVYLVSVLAFCVIMAKGFFDRIPLSLEEAAEIDGCTITQALVKVILPLLAPGMAAIFSFAFVNIWNELFVAVLFMSSPDKLTVPVALNSFISKAGISWDVLSAGIVVALLPTMLVFAVGQRYIVAGLTDGGVKE